MGAWLLRHQARRSEPHDEISRAIARQVAAAATGSDRTASHTPSTDTVNSAVRREASFGSIAPSAAAFPRAFENAARKRSMNYALEVCHPFRGVAVAAALHVDLGGRVLDLGELVG